MIETKIVCMGDSLTEGYGLDPAQRWTNLLQEDIGIECINSGISGDTTAGMLARFYPMVIAHQPTHVILFGGTNDVSLKLSQETILSNIITMARQARHNQIKPIIAIPTPFFIIGQYLESEIFLEPQSFYKQIILLQENLQQLALEKGIPVIDFSFGMKANFFMEDGVHPNETGHRLMKEIAKNALANLI